MDLWMQAGNLSESYEFLRLHRRGIDLESNMRGLDETKRLGSIGIKCFGCLLWEIDGHWVVQKRRNIIQEALFCSFSIDLGAG
jgi:hypothetical protein